MGRPKIEKETPKCPLCGGEMLIEYSCNFEQITQRAGWHLVFTPRMKFCAECSKTLLATVHQWYHSRNRTGNYNKAYILDETEI